MIQKQDIISILRIWNYWDRDFTQLNDRISYEKQIEEYRNAKEVIVLKGIRRCGKSTLLNLELKNLLKNIPKENTLFVNFEEPRFYNELSLEFMDYLLETYIEYLNPKGRIYLFLDEVQNVKGWEKWVLRNYEKQDVQIYVTGSSSKLLSKEFSTVLSGRHLGLEVYPLSFSEFISFKGINNLSKFDIISKRHELKKLFSEYVAWGGFPKVVDVNSESLKKDELISYFDTIILKDIAQRNNLKNIEELKKMIYYLFSNNTKLFSLNKLKNLNFGSFETIKNYLEFSKDVYLFFELPMFDYSVKKQIVNLKKIYAIDTGFVNSISFRFSEDYGRLLENLVFIELKRRGFEIYYHKQKKECDFVIKEGLGIIQVVQVTKFLNDEDTKKRELEGLIDAMESYNLKEGLILTDDEEYELEEEGFKIIVKPVWKWLLKE